MISHIKLNTVLREFCCENLAELDMYILRKCRVSQILRNMRTFSYTCTGRNSPGIRGRECSLPKKVF